MSLSGLSWKRGFRSREVALGVLEKEQNVTNVTREGHVTIRVTFSEKIKKYSAYGASPPRRDV